jgi:hypothetical protein
MQRRRQIDLACAEGPMFWCRTKGQRGQHKGLDPIPLRRSYLMIPIRQHEIGSTTGLLAKAT